MAEEQKKTIKVFVQAQQFSKNPAGDNFSLDREQLKLINNIRYPLRYHLKNYQDAEKKGHPDVINSGLPADGVKDFFDAGQIVKFEGYAYICQLGKLIHFLKSIEKKYSLNPPDKDSLKEVWDSLHEDGAIYTLRNKWTAHRSYDDPQGEKNSTHAEVLLNLDSVGTTVWEGVHHRFMLGEGINFDPCDFHPKLEGFLDWLNQAIAQA